MPSVLSVELGDDLVAELVANAAEYGVAGVSEFPALERELVPHAPVADETISA